MELHQILYFISSNCPIIIFDINNVIICKVASKAEIDVDLYSEYVLELAAGKWDDRINCSAVYIKIQK